MGDTLNEADETFFVNLSNPVNATIDRGQGRGVILTDDLSDTTPDAFGFTAQTGGGLEHYGDLEPDHGERDQCGGPD